MAISEELTPERLKEVLKRTSLTYDPEHKPIWNGELKINEDAQARRAYIYRVRAIYIACLPFIEKHMKRAKADEITNVNDLLKVEMIHAFKIAGVYIPQGFFPKKLIDDLTIAYTGGNYYNLLWNFLNPENLSSEMADYVVKFLEVEAEDFDMDSGGKLKPLYYDPLDDKKEGVKELHELLIHYSDYVKGDYTKSSEAKQIVGAMAGTW